MNKLYWLAAPVAGVAAYFATKRVRAMRMSMDRVNREGRREQYPPLTRRDVEYMNRVKERMLLGYHCTHPPLYS